MTKLAKSAVKIWLSEIAISFHLFIKLNINLFRVVRKKQSFFTAHTYSVSVSSSAINNVVFKKVNYCNKYIINKNLLMYNRNCTCFAKITNIVIIVKRYTSYRTFYNTTIKIKL